MELRLGKVQWMTFSTGLVNHDKIDYVSLVAEVYLVNFLECMSYRATHRIVITLR